MQKLLIAIKSEIICSTLAEVLHGIDVHICHNGKAALTLIDDLQPDMLILDLSLPRMDGLTVLRSANHKPSAIIALTSVTTDRILEEAYRAGVTEMIAVPCTLSLIADRLQSCLQKSPSPEL